MPAQETIGPARIPVGLQHIAVDFHWLLCHAMNNTACASHRLVSYAAAACCVREMRPTCELSIVSPQKANTGCLGLNLTSCMLQSLMLELLHVATSVTILNVAPTGRVAASN